MTILLITLLIICVLAVLHTYLLYPWWVIRRARTLQQAQPGTRVRREEQNSHEDWPAVFVLMAAHNEELVITDKLTSLAAQDYPGQLQFLIGSDNSSDQTNAILSDWAAKDHRFSPTLFSSRQGKPAIINQLAGRAGNEGIFVITDASVMLRPSVITELIRPMLSDPRIGVVDTTMVQTGAQAAGIGQPEEQYINREVAVKRAEGVLWGAMIGPFGGCWAIRGNAFNPIPDNFLVDDFFICMAAYEDGFRGVSSATAIVEEGVGQAIREEFRRKVRISSGNWQNLVRFRHLWWPFWRTPLAFAFFSHKVLRWWTPFLLLIGLACWLFLIATLGHPDNYWLSLTLKYLLAGLCLLLVLDPLLSRFNIHFRPVRFTRYFLAMNAALLVGFFRYLTGIKSNVWQPSQRH